MRIIFVIYLFFSQIIIGHGFIGDTSVHLADERLVPIKSVVVPKINKKHIFVKSYDYKNPCTIYHRIIESGTSVSPLGIRLGFDDDRANDIICTPTQVFYNSSRQWVIAHDLCIGDELVAIYNQQHKIVYKQMLNFSHVVYTFEVENTHTFFVGKQGILTHNMALPTSLLCESGLAFGGLGGFVGSLCSSPLVIVGAVIVAAGCAIAKAIKRKKVRKYKVPLRDVGNCKIYQTLDKNDSKKKKNIKKNKKSCNYAEEQKARKREHRPLTNEEARKIAKKLGYKEDKNPPFDTHGSITFRKGNDWITPDQDGHKGGVWKRYFKKKRLGTYNVDLTKMIGT